MKNNAHKRRSKRIHDAIQTDADVSICEKKNEFRVFYVSSLRLGRRRRNPKCEENIPFFHSLIWCAGGWKTYMEKLCLKGWQWNVFNPPFRDEFFHTHWVPRHSSSHSSSQYLPKETQCVPYVYRFIYRKSCDVHAVERFIT